MNYIDQVKEAAAYVQERLGAQPEVGIILGTGLGKLAHEISVEAAIPYGEIPHFPVSTVESHAGQLIFGKLGGKKVLAMQGRFHYYEGYSMKQVTLPVRVMHQLGIRTLMVSNASGGLNPSQSIADLMILSDHIDLFPESPLHGHHPPEFGPRFPDMSEVYDKELIEKALEIAHNHAIPAHTGVYVGVKGPNLETPAEYKYLRVIGGDAVGMSTVPEVTVACQMGMRIFAISAITDLGVEGKIKKVAIEDVLAAAAQAEKGMTTIIKELLASL
jgi:purine-nucleoside phosphorylase